MRKKTQNKGRKREKGKKTYQKVENLLVGETVGAREKTKS